MTALAAPRDCQEASPVEFEEIVKSGVTVYKGAIVGLNTSGTVQPMAASVSGGLRAIGAAQATVVGDGVLKVAIKSGAFLLHNSTAGDTLTNADIQAAVYAADDQTVAKTDGTATRAVMGRMLKIEPSTLKIVVAIGPVNYPDGDLVSTNNLSDVTVAATARANIGANRGHFTFPKISSKVADAEVARIVAGSAGTITLFKTVLNGALAAADATAQLKINGSNVGSTTTGLITATQSGSAAGDVDSATPATTNLAFVAGDVISVTVGGGSTATATLNATIEYTF